MTTGVQCDECHRFLPTEILEGGLVELGHYVKIDFLTGVKQNKPPEHYCYDPCWLAKARILEDTERR